MNGIPLLNKKCHRTSKEIGKAKIKHQRRISSDTFWGFMDDKVQEDAIPHQTNTIGQSVKKHGNHFGRGE